MKKSILIIILLIIVIAIIVGIVYFSTRKNENNIESTNSLSQEMIQNNLENDITANNNEIENTVSDNNINVNETQNLQNEGENVSMENARIKLTVNGNNEVYVRLDDNVASRDFLEMLPLTLTFEDFNSTEKIATLPSELNVDGLPSGYTPKVGDFSYYAPWGNISLFYKDFRYSNSLYKLGTIESGADIFENLNGDFEVTIERVD